MLCSYVGTHDLFADHTTLFADFVVPEGASTFRTWPKPTSIPWEQIDMERWHQNIAASPQPDFAEQTSTNFFAEWAQHWESALDGCVKTHPEGRLLSNFRGRAVRTAPLEGPVAAPVAKPSRQGEVALRTDLISASVQLWFKQLRRLQSYKHAALANKVTLDAEVYRLNLWTAIRGSLQAAPCQWVIASSPSY